MKGCDVWLNINQKKYFIQCSVNTELSVKKGFWLDDPEEATALLVTPYYTSLDFITSFSKRKGSMVDAFLQNKFGFVDVHSLLTQEDIDLLFRKKQKV